MVDKLQRSRHASFLLQIGGGEAFVSRFLVSGSLQHEGRKLPATARQVGPERTTEPRRRDRRVQALPSSQVCAWSVAKNFTK